MKIFSCNRNCGVLLALSTLMLTISSAQSFAACTYKVTNNWGSGFTGEITVTNDTTSTVNSWSVSWQESGVSVTNAWNATLSGANPYTATSLNWNGTLAPKASVSFGFQATGAAGTPKISGSLCGAATAPSSSSKSSLVVSSSSAKSNAVSSVAKSVSSQAQSSSSAAQGSWLFEENSLGFCNAADTVKTNQNGYTGTGYADTPDGADAAIGWSINAAAAKSYAIEFRFANGASMRRTKILVNNSQTQTVDFPATGAWNQWQTLSVNVPLKAGVNSVKIAADTSSGLPNVDYISVAGDGITPAACATVASSSSSSSSSTPSASGCPLIQEGFSTLNAMGQNGTTGGQGGKTVTVTNQADLNRYATAAEPYIIRVQGGIKFSPKGTEIRVASDKTIIGVGTSGEIIEGGFFLGAGVHNVIIRNLTIRDGFVDGDLEGKTNDFDAIQMDTAHHIWIDHNHLTRMGDGLIDSRKDTTYLTASWNILSDHNKAFGIGWTDNVTAQMTIHHNWLRDLSQRNPSTDNVLRAHLYNNWMQRLSSYGNYARQATNMVIENSVFDSLNNPHYYDTGSLVAIGNIYRSVKGQKESSGSAYSFFNPKNFYSYTLHPANEVEALLKKCAGPRPELGQ